MAHQERTQGELMKIKLLKLTNFRRFEEFTLTFESNVTVIVAKNGAGKSSVLDAVAVMIGSFLTRLPGVKGISPKEIDFHMRADRSKPAYMRLYCENIEGVAWDRTEKRDQSKGTAKEIPDAAGAGKLQAVYRVFLLSGSQRGKATERAAIF